VEVRSKILVYYSGLMYVKSICSVIEGYNFRVLVSHFKERNATWVAFKLSHENLMCFYSEDKSSQHLVT
jgi:hypothetical protein